MGVYLPHTLVGALMIATMLITMQANRHAYAASRRSGWALVLLWLAGGMSQPLPFFSMPLKKQPPLDCKYLQGPDYVHCAIGQRGDPALELCETALHSSLFPCTLHSSLFPCTPAYIPRVLQRFYAPSNARFELCQAVVSSIEPRLGPCMHCKACTGCRGASTLHHMCISCKGLHRGLHILVFLSALFFDFNADAIIIRVGTLVVFGLNCLSSRVGYGVCFGTAAPLSPPYIP